MNIQRETLAQSADLKELEERITEEAEARSLGEPRDRNDHGPVYINAKYDLRIERDPGQWGEYRLMLLHKLQPPTTMGNKLRGKLRRG